MFSYIVLQLLQPYNPARKTLRWYKKLGIHMLHRALLNSYIIAKKTGYDKDFLRFTKEVIIFLFGIYHIKMSATILAITLHASGLWGADVP